MKKIKLLFAYSAIIALVCGGFSGCKSDSDPAPGTETVFHSYKPQIGGKGTELVINGNNFGTDVAAVKVWVNESPAIVQKVTPTQIHTLIADGSGSGKIKVSVGEKEYAYPNPFTYTFIRKVKTYAGDGQGRWADGPLLSASIDYPHHLAYDKKDDALFVLGLGGSRAVCRIKNGYVETLIKFNDAAYGTQDLRNPESIGFSLDGDILFLPNDAHAPQMCIGYAKRSDDFRIVYPLIALAGNDTNGNLRGINGMDVNPVDGTLACYNWHKTVYLVDPGNGNIISKALINTIDAAGVYGNICFSNDGKTIYVTGRDGRDGPFMRLSKASYDLTTKTIGEFEVLAGAGSYGYVNEPGSAAKFDQLNQIAMGPDGNIYLPEGNGNFVVRQVTPEGSVSLYAGVPGANGYLDGLAPAAKFGYLAGIAFDNQGRMFLAEKPHGSNATNRIRMVYEE